VTSKELPTPGKPWRGGVISVPAFLNGCSVIASVARPTTPGEDSHQFMAVIVDDGKQGGIEGTLVVVQVSFGTGYRIRLKQPGYTSYQAAVADMLAQADIDNRAAEALAASAMDRDEYLQRLMEQDRMGHQQ